MERACQQRVESPGPISITHAFQSPVSEHLCKLLCSGNDMRDQGCGRVSDEYMRAPNWPGCG